MDFDKEFNKISSPFEKNIGLSQLENYSGRLNIANNEITNKDYVLTLDSAIAPIQNFSNIQIY